MAIHKLVVIIKNSLNEEQFLLVRQTPPPKSGEEEYDSYVDSDLWDLPSAPLNSLEEGSQCEISIEGAESCLEKINLRNFDTDSALNQVLLQLGVQRPIADRWALWKYVEEPEFGPGPLVNTVFILGKLLHEDVNPQGTSIVKAHGPNSSLKTGLQAVSKWTSIQSCLKFLLEVKPSSDRVGPFVVSGLITDSAQYRNWKVPQTLRYQEYPLGVTLVPMGSRTAKPFHTTNLVVVSPDKDVVYGSGDSRTVAYADALIMDPGCYSQFHAELTEIVVSLPRKLVVFVTHHHYDHVDGLSIIQKYNPDATLLAHENTMRRIGKDNWSLGYTSISGAEKIQIGDQQFDVIFAPGHTDGHMALLHVGTHSLIVGDHCVGQGSAFLDITAGGNMKDYFQTTYNFLELSPHALIPMHGRVNLWPKHMLCSYLKNRRNRESSILKAIESGAETLYDIVAKVYSDVDPRAWIAASSNVRLHVDHLSEQDKLPKDFSLENYNSSCTAFSVKLGSL